MQKVVYAGVRKQFGLSSQLAIRAISKTVEAYKRDKSIKVSFRREGAITYDERVMSFKGLNEVSLLTLSGRVLVPFRIGGYQESRLDQIKGQADLLLKQGTFYLAVTLDVPSPDPFVPEGGTSVLIWGLSKLQPIRRESSSVERQLSECVPACCDCAPIFSGVGPNRQNAISKSFLDARHASVATPTMLYRSISLSRHRTTGRLLLSRIFDTSDLVRG